MAVGGCCKPRRMALGFGLAGLACVVFGALMVVLMPGVLKQQVSKNLVLNPNSILFSMWTDLPVPFYFSIYLFEVLNSKDVLKGAKPKLIQRGPYVYREHRNKVNITFHENDTVSYLEYRQYHFQPDMSNGSEEDYIVVPNLLVMGTAAAMEDQSFTMKMMISSALAAFGQTAFINRTVGEILWGYKDRFLDFVNSIRPNLLPFKDKFGLLVQLNNSDSGMFTVHTGADDISKVHMMDNWGGSKKLSFWNSDQCNMINGTSGQVWPPFMTPSTPVEFFSPEACRSIRLEFKQPGSFEGIPVYRFVFPKTLFANGMDYPPNEGFCPCRQSGIQNLSSCQHNAPMFISSPHFFNADPSLLEAVDGLHPDEDAHGTVLDLHPMSGIPMNCSVRLQLNMFVKSVAGIIQTGMIKPVVLPVMWFEETGRIEGDFLTEFYTSMVLVPLVLEYGQYCLLALGGVFLITAALLGLKSMTPVLVWQKKGPVAIRTLSATKFFNRGQFQKYQGPQRDARREIQPPTPDRWERPAQDSGLETDPLLQEDYSTVNYT